MSGYKPLRSLLRLIDNVLQRSLFLMGTKRTLHDLPVSVSIPEPECEEPVFRKVESALGLIARYAPEKYRSMKKDVASIYVSGEFPGLGRYWPALKMVGLRADYVTDPETTHQAIACCLIHEAQHGHLFRLGFGYEEAVRARIEKICITAERNFARKLPGCEALVAKLEERIDFDWGPFISDKAKRRSEYEATLKYMKDREFPGWAIRFAEWTISRRMSQYNRSQV